uniref:uncharacterized protein LOC105351210 isoform X1 n=1 Tax=Fragaria vesca subsp. vesca TaxID=101020 RepID=UPI0005C9AC8B|nr:PREDICTED: uncharacterized protein LOC105351210 isoform X1 [Fragaria vesca subsp. vesca]
MDKRLDELTALLKNEQARNEILCNENKRLESEIEMLRRSKNLVEVEKQTSRTLRSRSECKKPSFLVDYITDNSRKGKGKFQVVNNDDDDDFVQSSPKKKKVPSVGQNIAVRRHRVGKCVAAPYAQKLKGYLAKGDRMTMVETSPQDWLKLTVRHSLIMSGRKTSCFSQLCTRNISTTPC